MPPVAGMGCAAGGWHVFSFPVAAVIVGVVSVPGNRGNGHALTHPFAVFGYPARRMVAPGTNSAARKTPAPALSTASCA
jgi:hypothetical protein